MKILGNKQVAGIGWNCNNRRLSQIGRPKCLVLYDLLPHANFLDSRNAGPRSCPILKFIALQMPCPYTQTNLDDLKSLSIILLLSVEVVEKDVAFLTLFAPITDHHTRAVDDLTWVTFAIDLACRLNRLASCHSGNIKITYKVLPIHRAASHQVP